MKPVADFIAFYTALDSVKRRVVDRHSEMVEFPKGAVIFERDSEADAAYAVEKGVVEIVLRNNESGITRSVAYLSRGDIFGEMGVLTGNPRVATVRACENVWLRKFSHERLIQLIERIPSFGIYLTANMAQRLHRATSDQYFMSYCVDFRGNMENFDLLIIFQTLQSNSRTGELQLTNTNNDIIGSFFFRDGSVEYARFYHLEGIESVWQLFLEEKLSGTFAFQITKKPTFKCDENLKIQINGTSLIMEAASKRDTFRNLSLNTQELNRPLSRRIEQFSWNNPETETAARAIWQHIQKKPLTLGTIWRLCNLSIMTLIETICAMQDRNLVELGQPLE